MCQEQCFGILKLVRPKEKLDRGGCKPGTMAIFVSTGFVWFFDVHCESIKCFEMNDSTVWGSRQSLIHRSFSLLNVSVIRFSGWGFSCRVNFLVDLLKTTETLTRECNNL